MHIRNYYENVRIHIRPVALFIRINDSVDSHRAISKHIRKNYAFKRVRQQPKDQN